MNRVINVKVRNKVATQTNDAVYICGNSDFVIHFDFDDEWAEYECKTARFVFDGKFIDVVFANSECPVPIMSDTYRIMVGVYVDNLYTTTPALISANKSILCGTAAPAPPHPDVYEQMKELFAAGLDSAWEGANAAKAAQTAAETAQAAAEQANTEAQSAKDEATRQAGIATTAREAAENAQKAAEEARGKAETAEKAAAESATNAEASAKAAAESANAAALSEGNAKTYKEGAEAAAVRSEKAAVEAETVVGNAAWIDAEIDENGHLIVTHSDNFNGAEFAITEDGSLEVTYL